MGDAPWELERTRSRSDFLIFAQAEWTRTYRDNASARAALFTRVTNSRFRPVIVTTAHARSIFSSPFSVGMKLLFTPWTAVVAGNNLCTPGICKTTQKVQHQTFVRITGGGWVGLHQSYHCSDFQKCPIIADHPLDLHVYKRMKIKILSVSARACVWVCVHARTCAPVRTCTNLFVSVCVH